jgi:hypothetical protein
MLRMKIQHRNHVILLGHEQCTIYYKIITDHAEVACGHKCSGDCASLRRIEELIKEYTGYDLELDDTGKGKTFL